MDQAYTMQLNQLLTCQVSVALQNNCLSAFSKFLEKHEYHKREDQDENKMNIMSCVMDDSLSDSHD